MVDFCLFPFSFALLWRGGRQRRPGARSSSGSINTKSIQREIAFPILMGRWRMRTPSRHCSRVCMVLSRRTFRSSRSGGDSGGPAVRFRFTIRAERKEPGISPLHYAGHGSYVDNPTSQETDKRDETIIPADSNTGTPDIRDKELAQHLSHRILDKKAQLIAIFDSCHSGSIARGLPDPIKNRFAPPQKPDSRSHGGKTPCTGVEERGALVWSAAQEHQPAQEKRIRDNHAVDLAVRSSTSCRVHTERVCRKLHLRVRAIMQASGSTQEPVLGATAEQRARGLWGLPIPEVASREAPLLL